LVRLACARLPILMRVLLNRVMGVLDMEESLMAKFSIPYIPSGYNGQLPSLWEA